MQENLYEKLEYKRKKSVLKSVTITDKFCEGFRIIEIEPYDDTGEKALETTPGSYDKALERIEQALKRALPGQLLRICVYTDKFGQFEYLFEA